MEFKEKERSRIDCSLEFRLTIFDSAYGVNNAAEKSTAPPETKLIIHSQKALPQLEKPAAPTISANHRAVVAEVFFTEYTFRQNLYNAKYKFITQKRKIRVILFHLFPESLENG